MKKMILETVSHDKNINWTTLLQQIIIIKPNKDMKIKLNQSFTHNKYYAYNNLNTPNGNKIMKLIQINNLKVNWSSSYIVKRIPFED